MNVAFTDDELNEALIVIVNEIAATANLNDKDRAMLKRWRTSNMRLGADDMIEFVEKANEDMALGLLRRERSQLRKPDWRQ